MDQVHVIRHKVLVEGLSVRLVAKQLGVSRNTVRRYLEGAEPGVRRAPTRARPVFEVVKSRLEELLDEAPRWTGGKQQLTAARLHELLVSEGHEVGYTIVKRFVREWKRRRREVFVPLIYRAGELAEVDFFEVLADVDGVRRKAWMFVMRLMYSGRDFAALYERQDQVSFLDAHVRAFTHFGAVPQRIVYDNLRLAVARVLVGSARELTRRFAALAAHYVFEPCFARPATGHDKGGVESAGKSVRLRELVPIPSGLSLDAISTALGERLDKRAAIRRDVQGRSVLERFADERAAMLPLPERPFAAEALRICRATRRSLVQLDGATYSVDCRWAGLDVDAYVGPSMVRFVGPDGEVLWRRGRFGERQVDYRHYLPELARKPQAVRQVAPELIAQLGAPFDALWRQLVDSHGPSEAARIFARVLGAFERLGRCGVVAGVERALVTSEPVLLCLRIEPPPIAMLVERLPASLQDVEVAAASAADFDELLGGAS